MFNLFKSKSDWPIEKAKSSVASNQGHYVDVREDFEVEAGHAKGAIWIPLSKLAANSQELLEQLKKQFGEDKEYFLYCRSGNRSGQAEMIFKSHGFKAYNIGGFADLAQNEILTDTGIPSRAL